MHNNNSNEECPYCFEIVKKGAIKCKHCHSIISTECPFCLKEIKAGAKKCKHCKSMIAPDTIINYALIKDDVVAPNGNHDTIFDDSKYSEASRVSLPSDGDIDQSQLPGFYAKEQSLKRPNHMPTVLLLCASLIVALIISTYNASNTNNNGKYKPGDSNTKIQTKSNYTPSSTNKNLTYDPADYDSDGNYKPVSSMTQKEIESELIKIFEENILSD